MVAGEDDIRPSDHSVVLDPNDEEQIHRLEARGIKPEQIKEVVEEGKELLHLFGSPWDGWTPGSHFLGQGESGQTFVTPKFGLDQSRVAFKWFNRNHETLRRDSNYEVVPPDGSERGSGQLQSEVYLYETLSKMKDYGNYIPRYFGTLSVDDDGNLVFDKWGIRMKGGPVGSEELSSMLSETRDRPIVLIELGSDVPRDERENAVSKAHNNLGFLGNHGFRYGGEEGRLDIKKFGRNYKFIDYGTSKIIGDRALVAEGYKKRPKDQYAEGRKKGPSRTPYDREKPRRGEL